MVHIFLFLLDNTAIKLLEIWKPQQNIKKKIITYNFISFLVISSEDTFNAFSDDYFSAYAMRISIIIHTDRQTDT